MDGKQSKPIKPTLNYQSQPMQSAISIKEKIKMKKEQESIDMNKPKIELGSKLNESSSIKKDIIDMKSSFTKFDFKNVPKSLMKVDRKSVV